MEDPSEIKDDKSFELKTSEEVAIIGYERKLIDHDQKLENHLTEIQTIRGENKNVMIGVLIAFLFTVVTVGMELMIFHTENNSEIEEFRKEYYGELEVLKTTSESC